MKRGTNNSKKRNAMRITIKNVIITLIPLGTPIFVKYTCTGLNKKAKTMLVNINEDKSPTTHKEKDPTASTAKRNINC